MALDTLPIDGVLPRIVAAVGEASSLVLKAPTGAGKTTRVAPALLDAGLAGAGIVLLEPRRVATRAAARRMATERGSKVGGEIGYQVRFDRKTGRATRITVMTEGVFVRHLQDDPFLERAGVVVFDEFHERSLDTDLAFAMTRKVQREARPDLKIVVMSATLDAGPVARFLGDCPVVESEGRLHPIEIDHVARARDERLELAVCAAVESVLDRTEGDLLVFLPGLGEIRRAGQALEGLVRKHDLSVMELYGDLPAERQDAVLRSGPRRKVVLATNVAETSVTIENVTAVIDSGLARTLRFDQSVGLDRLELGRISRVSADQRSGRAGRTAPGICLRLWSKHDDRSLSVREEPEIRRVDLSRAVLELRAWGEPSAADFPWFEAPDGRTIERAEELLVMLGALDGSGITELGHTMAKLPVAPRLARLLVEGHRRGQPERAALAAALLSERDPFRDIEGGLHGRSRSESDLLDRIVALEEIEARPRAGAGRSVSGLNLGAARFVLQARDQLLAMLRQACGDTPSGKDEAGDALPRALLAAFPDRVAARREPRSQRAVMTGGRGVRLADESAVATAVLFVCIDIDAGRRGARSEALVRLASAIEPEWLPEDALRVETAMRFDGERKRVVASSRTCYRDLPLAEKAAPIADPEQASRLLAKAAGEDIESALPLADRETADFLARLRSLRLWMPELELPAFDEAELRALLPELCAGHSSFEELRKVSLLDFLRNRLDHRRRGALERHAPERLEVPSGSRIRLAYEPGRPPVLAARIQEMFGLAETPRVADGRVPVLVHLLAPNGRPQQITEDLHSFWNTTYTEVRRELRRRYPKHAWPEDPWNAPAERRPRRR